MKRILFRICISLLLVPLLGHAQGTWDVGARFIPQATTFRYTQGIGPLYDFLKISAPYYFRVRTAQGVGATYNAFRNLHLGADLLYSLQGGGYEQRKTNLSYIKLPLWIGYHAAAKRKLVFTIQSGIEWSYLVSAKVKYADGAKENIKPSLTTISWGVPFAIGVKFRVLGAYYITILAYLYTDINSLSKTNRTFGVYNYSYPGLRISIDQPLNQLLKKK